jgi:hypothetical protein
MLGFIAGAITVAAGIFGFSFARNYTLRRLRFVDSVRSPAWPWIIGLIAAVVTAPLSFLPLVTAGTAVVFGLGTGLGTASGVKALRRGGN